jgi:hypothetical protein
MVTRGMKARYVFADLQKVRISLLDGDCPDAAWPAVT